MPSLTSFDLSELFLTCLLPTLSFGSCVAAFATAHDEQRFDATLHVVEAHGPGFAATASAMTFDSTYRARLPRRTPDVFDPVTLGPVTVRNRVVKAATFEGRTPDALVTDELVDFHRADRSRRRRDDHDGVRRGGTRGAHAPGADPAPRGGLARPGPSHRRGPRRRAPRSPAQIGHAGPVANGRSNGVHAVAPSSMPSPLSMQMVRKASEADLSRIPRDYVAGVRLAVRAGFDALEIHLGHGYLLSSFLSPTRTAAGTGTAASLENRARYPRGPPRGPRRGRRTRWRSTPSSA